MNAASLCLPPPSVGIHFDSREHVTAADSCHAHADCGYRDDQNRAAAEWGGRTVAGTKGGSYSVYSDGRSARTIETSGCSGCAQVEVMMGGRRWQEGEGSGTLWLAATNCASSSRRFSGTKERRRPLASSDKDGARSVGDCGALLTTHTFRRFRWAVEGEWSKTSRRAAAAATMVQLELHEAV